MAAGTIMAARLTTSSAASRLQALVTLNQTEVRFPARCNLFGP